MKHWSNSYSHVHIKQAVWNAHTNYREYKEKNTLLGEYLISISLDLWIYCVQNI